MGHDQNHTKKTDRTKVKKVKFDSAQNRMYHMKNLKAK